MQIETMLIAGGVINIGRGKCNEHGRKHYHAAIIFNFTSVKDNSRLLRKKHRKSSDAIDYGIRFINRFRRSFNTKLELEKEDAVSRTND